ncbi:MAG: hypothetical protein HY015_06360 [Bacteroidetes bacterium]|nr:hypothetical protein [Bacteroidota bacterium]MBI3482586.1 hypothetical protein [Bacteroidota bacterium]
MKRGIRIVLAIIVFVPLAIAVVGFITMSLWNWLVPELFHGPVITFWQALGLLILSKILFWSFGKKHYGHGGHWRPYWKERWNRMSMEDRERFKQKMKEKWCGWGERSSGEKTSTPNA